MLRKSPRAVYRNVFGTVSLIIDIMKLFPKIIHSTYDLKNRLRKYWKNTVCFMNCHGYKGRFI